MVSIFLSYAHEDEPLLRKLETHLSLLKQQGLISTWYDRQIVPGTNWTEVINERLEQASIILLLVSSDFLASDYCSQIEVKRAIERHKAGEACVIPLAMRPVDWKGAPFAHLQALPSNAKAVTTWDNQDEAFVDVVAGIRRAIEHLSLLPTSVLHVALPVIWNIPYPRNPFFTGRDQELEYLHIRLQQNSTAVVSQMQHISGLGGIGKTQLAVEYAYRYRQEYQVVLWARADTTETLTTSYAEIATLLNLPQRDTQQQEVLVQVVKGWLSTQPHWLLILDNADESAVLVPFVPPQIRGHILVTTRATDLSQLGLGFRHAFAVQVFTDEQGTLFLLQRANLLAPDATLDQAELRDHILALQIVQELGGLPLALDQAGAYLNATNVSLDTYQQIYLQQRARLLTERRGAEHPEPVATTWDISFRKVEQQKPAAADLLRFCAFLAPDAIPEEILTKGAQKLGDVLAPVAVDAFLLNDAIVALRAYSLLDRDPQARMLSVHRLVQAVLRDSMPTETQKQWMQRAVLAVNAALPRVEFAHWSVYERCIPHALLCATWIKQALLVRPEAAELLNKTGYYLHERGRYAGVEVFQKQALAISEQASGAEHERTAISLAHLGYFYHSQGRYVEAEPLYQRALAIREERLGTKHPDTARSLNNLAGLYESQGKYAEAEPLYQRALAIREEQLGIKHRSTATSLNNLAGLYMSQGRYAEAEPLYQRALVIREEQLEANHPDRATSLNNLAGLYEGQGKHAEAEPLYQRALVIREEQLGVEHPQTQKARRNYATLLRAMGRDVEAKKLEEGS